MSDINKDTNESMTPIETENVSSGVEISMDDIDIQTPEQLTTGQKMKYLFMYPLVTSIIKWSFAVLGLVGLILFIVASVSQDASAALTKGLQRPVTDFFTKIYNAIPISMMEIFIFAAILGILAYLVFIIVRTCQVKGGFRKGGLWMQFFYTLVAVASVFCLLFSMCCGVALNNKPFSSISTYSDTEVTQLEFNESLIYLVDKINNVLARDIDETKSIFFTKDGASKYAQSGRSTDVIAEKLSEAFDNAAEEIPELKGSAVVPKELLLVDLYSLMQIGSIYSPFTGEVNVNTYYTEVAIPVQIAKSMAKQRGFTNDDDASFIAFLVCTQYTDDPYINYAGYFDAYINVGTAVYNQDGGKDLHLYIANALKESAKREVVNYVKNLDSLYGITSDLNFDSSGEKTSTDSYYDLAKLLLVDLRNKVDTGSVTLDDVEPVSYGRYCNYIVNFYNSDTQFQNDVETTYYEYHPDELQTTTPDTTTTDESGLLDTSDSSDSLVA